MNLFICFFRGKEFWAILLLHFYSITAHLKSSESIFTLIIIRLHIYRACYKQTHPLSLWEAGSAGELWKQGTGLSSRVRISVRMGALDLLVPLPHSHSQIVHFPKNFKSLLGKCDQYIFRLAFLGKRFM